MPDTSNKQQKRQYVVSTYLSAEERTRLITISGKIDIPHSRIVRQLICYLLQGEIDWLEMLEKTNAFNALGIKSDKSNAKKHVIRITLSKDIYINFSEYVAKKDSLTTKTLRRLILLFINNEIEWEKLWM